MGNRKLKQHANNPQHINSKSKKVAQEAPLPLWKYFLGVLSAKAADLRAISPISLLGEKWCAENKNKSHPLTSYDIELRDTKDSGQIERLDEIIDHMNKLSLLSKKSHGYYLELALLQNTALRHAIAQRIYERSCLPEDSKKRIDLPHLLAEKDNMLIKWLKTPTNRGASWGLSSLWHGSTSSFKWLQAAPTAHKPSYKKKIK